MMSYLLYMTHGCFSYTGLFDDYDYEIRILLEGPEEGMLRLTLK